MAEDTRHTHINARTVTASLHLYIDSEVLVGAWKVLCNVFSLWKEHRHTAVQVMYRTYTMYFHVQMTIHCTCVHVPCTCRWKDMKVYTGALDKIIITVYTFSKPTWTQIGYTSSLLIFVYITERERERYISNCYGVPVSGKWGSPGYYSHSDTTWCTCTQIATGDSYSWYVHSTYTQCTYTYIHCLTVYCMSHAQLTLMSCVCDICFFHNRAPGGGSSASSPSGSKPI